MAVTVRPAIDDDFEQLSRLDLSYPTDRYLHIERSGEAAEQTFRLEWRQREPGERVYASYSVERLRGAVDRADLFLAALVESSPAGLLMIVVPSWTDAAEITDLAVDRAARRHGVGRALVEWAATWALERGYRSLWVEPRTDNPNAIEFYLKVGFRLSGFNDRMYSNLDHEHGQTTLFMHLDLA